MRRVFAGLGAAAIFAIAGSAHAGFILTTDIVDPVPNNNDFRVNLIAAGVDRFTQGAGQLLDISGAGKIEFFL